MGPTRGIGIGAAVLTAVAAQGREAGAGQVATLRVDPERTRAYVIVRLGSSELEGLAAVGVSGEITVETDSRDQPSWATVRGISLTTDSAVVVSIPVAFRPLPITVSTLRLTQAGPTGPVPVIHGEFALPDLSAAMNGAVTYSADAVVCPRLPAGLPCLLTDAPLADQLSASGLTAAALHQTAAGLELTGTLAAGAPMVADSPGAGTVTLSVALVARGTGCAADADGNGAVQVADIFAFLRAWFAGSGGADADGNGLVQVADIFAFLRAWFAGC